MSDLPTELKYASSHEWARLDSDGTVVVGITDHAQEALGDIVYIELPEAGASVDAGAEVVEINPALEDEPETVNGSPYADGWLFRVKVSGPEELEDMMDADAYQIAVDES